MLDIGEEFWFWPEPIGEASEMIELMVEAALSFACAVHDAQELQLLPIFFA